MATRKRRRPAEAPMTGFAWLCLAAIVVELAYLFYEYGGFNPRW